MIARFCATLVLAVVATTASAEEPAATTDTGRNTIYLQAGLASDASDMGGAAVGGTVIRELGSRLALEGTGVFLSRGMGSSALSLSASLLVNLRPGREKAVPYLAVGGGLYRASSDMGDSRFTGPMGYGMMGGPYSGGQWNYGQMPMFYGNRMGPAGQDGRSYGQRGFTDPAVSVGGGIKVDLGSRLSLRPDARALVVTSGGDTYTVGLFTVNFGYRF